MSHQPGAPEDAVVERFSPTSGRMPGVIGLITVGVVLVIAVYDRSTGTPLGVAIIACAGGVLVWASLLRPVVWATQRDLVLRSILRTERVPLAAIERVAITQVLTVTAGGRKFVSPAIGYTTRQTVRGKAAQRHDQFGTSSRRSVDPRDAYQGFVAQRIVQLAAEARERTGIAPDSPEQTALASDIRRAWAWPEITALGVAALAFVVWLLA